MSAFAKPPLWQRLRPAFEGFDGVLALVNVALWFLCYRVVKSGWKLRA